MSDLRHAVLSGATSLVQHCCTYNDASIDRPSVATQHCLLYTSYYTLNVFDTVQSNTQHYKQMSTSLSYIMASRPMHAHGMASPQELMAVPASYCIHRNQFVWYHYSYKLGMRWMATMLLFATESIHYMTLQSLPCAFRSCITLALC